MKRLQKLVPVFAMFVVISGVRGATAPTPAAPAAGERIVLIGNALAERMQYYGNFETLLQQRFPGKNLLVRNLAESGDTPAYRPRAGRPTAGAFPGAEKFRPEVAKHLGQGVYPTEDEWLTFVKADTIVACFGFNESFDGEAGLENFSGELAAFVDHTLRQKYNGRSAPRLILASPVAFENLSARKDLPDGRAENARLALYTEAMRKVAAAKGVEFLDLFTSSRQWYASAPAPLTINGVHLNDAGDRHLAASLVDALYGGGEIGSRADPATLRAMVNEKDWFWLNDFRVLNGVHVYGQRRAPYGTANYPQEIEKIRQMTALRDQRVWDIASSRSTSLQVDDSSTRPLDPVQSNVTRPITYLSTADAVAKFTLPEGYKIELFAAESEFPDLKNPVQMTFDNRGRLWVAVLPSYPHFRPGDPKPDDKILILEDTDGDGRADKQIVFARGLHMPTSFEIRAEGVYVAQQPNLVLLQDTDGDDHADRKEYVMHGFDSHDTHHAIHAFVADASGAFYLHEGRFLHSQVETPYGPVRSNDGGVYRFDPKSSRMERYSQYDYSNPWGMAFDAWGQNFLSDASSGDNFWMLPMTLKLPFGVEQPGETRFTDANQKVRPTAGAEFISSRHFPDEVQGDFLVNNTIGFLGTKQFKMRDDGAGFRGEFRQNLLTSSDPNFRPVDMEFAPDGSLYLVDWHNALIGHMQHSARDPNRDHEHGRIYRITYPSRPLVKPSVVAGESIPALLDELKLPEYRTRYRVQRELQGRPAAEVLSAVRRWVAALDRQDPKFNHHLLEALWVTWGQNQIDRPLLEQCLRSDTPELRAAATRVLRHEFAKIPNSAALLKQSAADAHPRVRLEATVASSWVGGETGAEILLEALRHPLDPWMENAALFAMVPLKPAAQALVQAGRVSLSDNPVARGLLGRDLRFSGNNAALTKTIDPRVATRLGAEGVELWKVGQDIYSRDGFCSTCHQPDGEGIPKIYPPLARSEWVGDDENRLIKLLLHGLTGPMTVRGESYTAALTPPMPGFGAMLNDREIAGVLTYVRSTFGNRGGVVTPGQVQAQREATKARTTFYQTTELLQEHPFAPAPP